MKNRTGFVSNSSSSSFVCAVSGESYEGYDGQYDVPYACCTNGHEFCANFLLEAAAVEKTVDEMRTELIDNSHDKKMTIAYKNASDDDIREWWNDEFKCDEEDYYEVSPERCPICSFVYGEMSTLLCHLLVKASTTEEQVLAELKEQFGSYEAFLASIKGKDVLKSR